MMAGRMPDRHGTAGVRGSTSPTAALQSDPPACEPSTTAANATEREGRLKQWRPEQPERPQVPHFAPVSPGPHLLPFAK